MSDTPEDEARAKLNEAATKFGQSLVDAMNVSFRVSVAKQIVKEFGPGPWILHEDGRVTPHLTVVPPPQPNRILWNVRGGGIDEIVVHDATVHVEQMDNRCWWIGIDLPGGAHWAGNFHADSRGRMTFTEQENIDLVWDTDNSHDDPPKPKRVK